MWQSWPLHAPAATGLGSILDTLIAKHDPGFGIPELLRFLSDDCPKRQSLSTYDICGIHCPELPTYFRP